MSDYENMREVLLANHPARSDPRRLFVRLRKLTSDGAELFENTRRHAGWIAALVALAELLRLSSFSHLAGA
jgi:hypothetical protein